MSSDHVRDAILEHAGRLFADRGFQPTTVRDICQAAGVNVAAVNYYFRNKRNLYLEAVTHAYQRRSSEVPMPVWPSGTPPAEKLRGFVATTMYRMMGLDEAPWTTRLMTREVLSPTEACQALVTEYFRPQMELLEQDPPGVAAGRPAAASTASIGIQCGWSVFVLSHGGRCRGDDDLA